jgi:hypothetical protein
MRQERNLVSAILAALMLASGLASLAQTTGGSLQGKIVDEVGQPIPGVLIQLSGPSLQGYLGAATDAGGQYVIPYVPTGRAYEVKAEAQGYATVVRKGIQIPLGARVELPFTMSEGKTEVTVTAGAPLIDLKSDETGITLSSRMIETLPLRRDSNDLAFYAPTAVSSGSSTPGMVSIGGSTGGENVYLVNGVDITDTGYGTTSFATARSLPPELILPQTVAGSLTGNMLNFDFIRDIQVMTGGVSPEYGGFMGGIVNAVTRSGGNEYHGSLFAYYWSDSLQAQSGKYTYTPGAMGNAGYTFGTGGYTRYDVGGDLGGYFVKDKLWFWVGYDYNSVEQYTDVPVGPAYGDQRLYLNGQPAQSASSGQTITDISETNQQVAFKLTWNISPNHKLALSVFGNDDRLDRLTTLATLSPDTTPYTTKTPAVNLSLQWNATWSPTFFTEAVVSYRHRTQKAEPTSAGADKWAYICNNTSFMAMPKSEYIPPVSISDHTFRFDMGSNYAPNRGFGYAGRIDEDTSLQFRLKATNLFGAAGRHELSYGFQADDRRFTPVDWFSGPKDFVSPGTGRQAVAGLSIYWTPHSLWGFPAGPNGEQYIYIAWQYLSPGAKPSTWRTASGWVNDNWFLTDFFTLKLGLRYDDEKIEGKQPGGASIDLKDSWAPRLGFTWDVAHNGKSKLYGAWGRYYQRVPASLGSDALNPGLQALEVFYDRNLTVWAKLLREYGGTTANVQGQTPGLPVNAPLKAPYTDETMLGFDYEVRPDLRLGVRAVYRELGRALESLSFWNPKDEGHMDSALANPDLWTDVPVPQLNQDGTPNWNKLYYYPKPTRIYKALEVTLDKRFSDHWQMGASYVLSRLEGNYEGQTNLNDSGDGQLFPNNSMAFDDPQKTANTSGLLPLDRTHVLKVYGGYFFPNIPLELSASFGLQSGAPVSKMLLYAWNGTYAYYDTRGANGRTPTTWALDMGVQYTFRLGKRLGDLALRLDVFNVTNNQATTTVYQTWAIQSYPSGPWLPETNYWSKPYAHQPPRLLRLGLRWMF